MRIYAMVIDAGGEDAHIVAALTEEELADTVGRTAMRENEVEVIELEDGDVLRAVADTIDDDRAFDDALDADEEDDDEEADADDSDEPLDDEDEPADDDE